MSDIQLNLQEIVKILPHRYPFLLIDRVIELKPQTEGGYVRALKNVTFNEHFFQGHFPGLPVMPGVLILEAMAQAGGVLAYHFSPEHAGRTLLFMSIDKVKFRQPVVPGDQLILQINHLHKSSRAFRMEGKAMVEGKVVAQAEFTAALA